MTFQEWQTTRKEVANIAEALGFAAPYVSRGPGYIYAGDLYIQFETRGSERGYLLTTPRSSLMEGGVSVSLRDLDAAERMLWEACGGVS